MSAKKLNELYYTPSLTSSLGGARRLRGAVRDLKRRISEGNVNQWLQGQDPYTLHKRARTRFPRRRVTVNGENQQFQADLIDTQSSASENDGHTFILTAIDVFSKRGMAIPVKNKSGAVMADALTLLLKDESLRTLQTDKGLEFVSQKPQQALKKMGIDHFVTQNETIKASIVERFNRTLQDKMYRYFTYTGDRRYVEILPEIISAYNATKHSSTGIAPNGIDDENREDIWLKMNMPTVAPKQPSLAYGEYVRITKKRLAFERGYTPNWSFEIFIINDILTTQPVTYRIRDLLDEIIKGSFYEQELQKVRKPTKFKVERVMRTRGKGRKKEHLVRYMGYPEKFDQWITHSQFTNL